jgi:flagellar hook-associated protein FlgK
MNDLLNIGLSGLTAYRNALSTVGENVSNAENARLFAARDHSLTKV